MDEKLLALAGQPKEEKGAPKTFKEFDDESESDEVEASRDVSGERKFACPCCKGMIKMSVGKA